MRRIAMAGSFGLGADVGRMYGHWTPESANPRTPPPLTLVTHAEAQVRSRRRRLPTGAETAGAATRGGSGSDQGARPRTASGRCTRRPLRALSV